MTMNRSASGKRFWLLALGVWACLSIAGCSSSGSAGDRGAGDVSPGATPATSTTPASGGGSSTPATTPSETTTTTAAPVPSASTHTRAASEISLALLDEYAFAPGVHVVTTPTNSAGQSGSGAAAGGTMTSDNPKCAPFVGETNTAGNAGTPGVTGYDKRKFQADGEPTSFLTEEITTMGSPEHVADLLAALNDSIHGCTKLTFSYPGAKSSTMTVSAAPAPPHGDPPTAVHVVGCQRPLETVPMLAIVFAVCRMP